MVSYYVDGEIVNYELTKKENGSIDYVEVSRIPADYMQTLVNASYSPFMDRNEYYELGIKFLNLLAQAKANTKARNLMRGITKKEPSSDNNMVKTK